MKDRAVKAGQTWVFRDPYTHLELILLTVRPPTPGWAEWACLVLDTTSTRWTPGQLEDFAVNNSDWWERLA